MRRCVELIARERSAISVASKPGERIALRAGYVHVPRQHTRLTYYVDEALKQAGFRVPTGLNPSAAKLIYEPAVRLITGTDHRPSTPTPERSAASSRHAQS